MRKTLITKLHDLAEDKNVEITAQEAEWIVKDWLHTHSRTKIKDQRITINLQENVEIEQ